MARLFAARTRCKVAREDGVALLLALWVLVLLSFTGLELGVFSRVDTGSTRAFKERLQTYYIARGGVERGLSMLEEYYRRYPPTRFAAKQLAQQYGAESQPPLLAYLAAHGKERVPLGSGWSVLRFEDLSGKVNVNRADPEMLANLIQRAGLDRSRAEELADGILDWIDADDLHRARGAEGEYYVGRRRPTPRNAPIYELRELLLVKGMTREILYGNDDRGSLGSAMASDGLAVDPRRRGGSRMQGGRRGGLARFLTTDGTGKINVNSAPAEVLLAIPGMDEAIVTRLLAERQFRHLSSLEDVFGTAATARMASSPLLGVLAFQATEMRVEGVGKMPGGSMTSRVSATVSILPAGMIVRSWQDDSAGGLPLVPTRFITAAEEL